MDPRMNLKAISLLALATCLVAAPVSAMRSPTTSLSDTDDDGTSSGASVSPRGHLVYDEAAVTTTQRPASASPDTTAATQRPASVSPDEEDILALFSQPIAPAARNQQSLMDALLSPASASAARLPASHDFLDDLFGAESAAPTTTTAPAPSLVALQWDNALAALNASKPQASATARGTNPFDSASSSAASSASSSATSSRENSRANSPVRTILQPAASQSAAPMRSESRDASPVEAQKEALLSPGRKQMLDQLTAVMQSAGASMEMLVSGHSRAATGDAASLSSESSDGSAPSVTGGPAVDHEEVGSSGRFSVDSEASGELNVQPREEESVRRVASLSSFEELTSVGGTSSASKPTATTARPASVTLSPELSAAPFAVEQAPSNPSDSDSESSASHSNLGDAQNTGNRSATPDSGELADLLRGDVAAAPSAMSTSSHEDADSLQSIEDDVPSAAPRTSAAPVETALLTSPPSARSDASLTIDLDETIASARKTLEQSTAEYRALESRHEALRGEYEKLMTVYYVDYFRQEAELEAGRDKARESLERALWHKNDLARSVSMMAEERARTLKNLSHQQALVHAAHQRAFETLKGDGILDFLLDDVTQTAQSFTVAKGEKEEEVRVIDEFVNTVQRLKNTLSDERGPLSERAQRALILASGYVKDFQYFSKKLPAPRSNGNPRTIVTHLTALNAFLESVGPEGRLKHLEHETHRLRQETRTLQREISSELETNQQYKQEIAQSEAVLRDSNVPLEEIHKAKASTSELLQQIDAARYKVEDALTSAKQTMEGDRSRLESFLSLKDGSK